MICPTSKTIMATAIDMVMADHGSGSSCLNLKQIGEKETVSSFEEKKLVQIWSQ
jgi:hypothetical protein